MEENRNLPAAPVDPSVVDLIRVMAPKSISYPDDQIVHIVTIQELELLKRIANPVQAGIALAFAGMAIPSIPGALAVFRTDVPISAEAVAWVAVFSVATAIAAVCGWNGFRNRTDADDLIEKIRKRRKIPLVPPDEAPDSPNLA